MWNEILQTMLIPKSIHFAKNKRNEVKVEVQAYLFLQNRRLLPFSSDSGNVNAEERTGETGEMEVGVSDNQ